MFIVTDYTRNGQQIFLDGRDFLCPICKKGSLIYRDHCKRLIRHEGGSCEWISIPRHKCSNPQCKKIHRMLPASLVPHKHYPEEIISGVLDNVISSDDADSEDFPSYIFKP